MKVMVNSLTPHLIPTLTSSLTHCLLGHRVSIIAAMVDTKHDKCEQRLQNEWHVGSSIQEQCVQSCTPSLLPSRLHRDGHSIVLCCIVFASRRGPPGCKEGHRASRRGPSGCKEGPAQRRGPRGQRASRRGPRGQRAWSAGPQETAGAARISAWAPGAVYGDYHLGSSPCGP